MRLAASSPTGSWAVKFPSLSQHIDRLKCVHVWQCVCVFASTRVISSGQVSVCLPVSLLWGKCLPKECTTSDLSWTSIVRLIQPVPWGWAVLCPGKWEICAFLPFLLLLLSVFAHVLGRQKYATRWKSIKDESPEPHREKKSGNCYLVVLSFESESGFSSLGCLFSWDLALELHKVVTPQLCIKG